MLKRKKAKTETEYNSLCTKLTSYTLYVSAAINHEINDSILVRGENPIFRFGRGWDCRASSPIRMSDWAPRRKSEYMGELHDGQFSTKLKGYHVRDLDVVDKDSS